MAINKDFIIPDGGLQVKEASTFSNNVTIAGDLTVSGTTTYVNTATLNIADNVITLNADLPPGSAPTENSGIEINRGSAANVALRWSESAGVWTVTQDGTNFGRIHSKLTDIALGTDTSGNYVATIASGNGLTGSGTGEGSTPSLAVVAGAGIASNTSGVHVVAGSGVASNTTGVHVVAGSGVASNTTGVHVVAGTELTSNATGVHHNDITRTNTTAGNTSPNYGGTFTAVDSVTTNARGHVTGVNTKTVTMPSSNNTTYTLSSIANTTTSNAILRLTDSSNVNNNVLIVGTGTTTTSSNATHIIVNSADQFTGTITGVTAGAGLSGGGTTGTVTLDVGAGNGMAVDADSIRVVAGTGVTSNATGVHIGQSVATTAGVTFANVTIQNNATFGVLSVVSTAGTTGGTANIQFTANVGTMSLKTVPTSNSSPWIGLYTGDALASGAAGSINIQAGISNTGLNGDGSVTIWAGTQKHANSGAGGDVYIYSGDHNGSGSGGTGVSGGLIRIEAGGITGTPTTTIKTAGTVQIDAGSPGTVGTAGNIEIGCRRPVGSLRIGGTAAYGVANLVIGSANTTKTVIYANGGVGTSGQVLYSNGSSAYWSNLPADSDTLQSISDDTSTNATYYPSFVTSTSGAQTGRVSSTKLTFNPSTGFLSSTGVAITSALRETRTTTSGNAINLNNGSYFTHTVSGSTTFSVTNVPSTGTAVSFILDITNGGLAAVTWWSGIKWPNGYAPALTTSGRDVLGFTTYDGGTTWNGLVLGYDLK